MKENLIKAVLFLPLLAASLASCGGNNQETLTLRVYNCEDYMADEVLESFKEEESEVLSKELGREVKVNIIYDTYDTNETMLSSLKTGKTTYDLICASDYTLQKMVNSKMCQPIHMENVPNYNDYCSPFLLEKMASITTTVDEKEVNMGDYSVGYMWGTLGILYNPNKVAQDKQLKTVIDEEEVYDLDQVKFDMSDWRSLWDSKYHGEMSVKDSMRDTYSVGVMKYFDQEIREKLAETGYFDDDFNLSGDFNEAMESYNKWITNIFNTCDEETVNKIENVLLELKDNVFGFEVDSGKDDIVKGLVGMNLAWSGDAVYSMDRGDNESGQTIYYSVPKTGGNIWFDGWVMMKDIDEMQVRLSEDFLNYLCDPETASINMDDIGYTSFIAGDTIHELIRDWYDPRSYAMYVYEEAEWWEDSDFAYDEDENKIYQTGFDLDNDSIEEFDPSKGILDMTDSTYEAPVIDGVEHTWEEYIDIYNEKAEAINALIENEDDQIELLEGWDVRDLTYMFEGTLEYDAIEAPYGELPENNPYLFYTDELETISSPVEGSEEVSIAGRQFYAQYPDQNMIPKLAVMSDYGKNNVYVLAMWQNLKGNIIPLADAIIIGSILLVLVIAFISYLVYKKQLRKIKLRRRAAVRALHNS